MIDAWRSARNRAMGAVAAGSDDGAADAFREMAAVEKSALSEGSAADRLSLAMAVAEGDADGELLGPAWDIVRAVARDLAS